LIRARRNVKRFMYGKPRWRDLGTLLSLLFVGLSRFGLALACDATEPPALDELERRAATIGQVDVEVENIFDPSKPGESAAPYRWANQLHLRTQDDAIRSQLLFHPSDPLSVREVAETERLLRGRRYIFDAWIEPTCYHPASNEVDLNVRVRDVWSLNPGLSFSRAGGANRAGIGIEDQDFLGRGESVSLSWGRNVDRDTLLLTYSDPQILGSWWQGRVAYSDNSDGSFGELDLALPFYSLDSRWSAGTSLASGDRTDSRYQEGEVLDSFGESSDRVELYGGFSEGLRDGWARRWLAGLRYESSTFAASTDAMLAAPLPSDRTLFYPWVGLEWVEDDFVTTRNQDQLARTEDLQFGRSLRAEVGLASSILGSDRTAMIWKLGTSAGIRPGEAQSLFYSGNLTARLESDGLRDTLLTGETRYYFRQSPHALLFATARGAVAERPDLDHQILLGGDNGLRGYPLRYQSGTASAVVTVEERFYTDWYPFRLFNVGAAVFADAGRTWGRDVAGQEPLGLLSDVGVGLRIGNTRSGLGNVLHVDLAMPLARQNDISSIQLLVETRHSF
jgi:hypothetical protein